MATTKIQSGAFPTDVVNTAAIDDLAVTHAKLHTTMDLSSKTVTLPTLSTLNTTGNVGIGTSSIASNTKLIVKAATDQNFEVEYTSGKLRLSALNDARSANVPLQFASTSFEFLSGKVGIGASSISSGFKTEINHSGETYGIKLTDGSGRNIRFGAGDCEISSTGSNFDIRTTDLRHLIFRTNNVPRMQIHADGHIGFGDNVINDSAWSTVFGARSQWDTKGVVAATDGSMQIGHNWYYDAGGTTGYKYIASGKANRMIHVDDYISWETTDTAGSAGGEITMTEKMRLTSSGNVGIGTSNPSAKLHINSTDGMIIPVGTEAQRQSTPSAGTIRFNSSSASFEGYNGSTWVTLSGNFVNTKSIKFALGSYVDLAGGPNLGTGTWTASFWIKPTQNNLAYQEYFSAPGSNIISNGQYLLGANNTFVNAWSNYATSTFPLTLNEWYNIVYVRPSAASSGSGSLLLYVNGELNKSGNTGAASGIQTYANLKLGSDNSGEHSTVYMDEVALWDTALSASAIKDIYNDGSPSDLMSTVGNYSSASDLIGYWRFSEGTGTTVADLSGNSYDGTLNGSVSWSDQTPETNWSQITDIFNDGSCKAHYLLDNNGYDKSVNSNYATSFVTGSGTYSTSIKAFGTHSFSTSNSTMDLPDVVTSYPFTVSAWVYKSNWTATGTQNHLVMNAAINSSQRISLCHVDWNNNGGYEWSIMYGGTNHWTFAPGSMNNGQWYHVIFAVNSSNNSSHAVYLNGTALSATNRGGGHGGTAGWALGGNFDGSENFNGQISNVRVFNRQLSAAEAMSLYSKENLNLYP